VKKREGRREGGREGERGEGERGKKKSPVTDVHVLVISIPLTFGKHLASFPTQQEKCLASHMRLVRKVSNPKDAYAIAVM